MHEREKAAMSLASVIKDAETLRDKNAELNARIQVISSIHAYLLIRLCGTQFTCSGMLIHTYIHADMICRTVLLASVFGGMWSVLLQECWDMRTCPANVAHIYKCQCYSYFTDASFTHILHMPVLPDGLQPAAYAHVVVQTRFTYTHTDSCT